MIPRSPFMSLFFIGLIIIQSFQFYNIVNPYLSSRVRAFWFPLFHQAFAAHYHRLVGKELIRETSFSVLNDLVHVLLFRQYTTLAC